MTSFSSLTWSKLASGQEVLSLYTSCDKLVCLLDAKPLEGYACITVVPLLSINKLGK